MGDEIYEHNRLDDSDDDTIAERFRTSGDNKFFAELVRRHGSRVRRCCRAFLHDDGLADDMTQETFWRAFAKFAQFKGGNFRAWTLSIARTTCLNFLDSQKKTIALDAARDVKSPLDLASQAATRSQVLDVLRTLSPEQRICVNLFHGEGLTMLEIVAKTGYDMKKVRTCLQNGRLKFEKEWNKRNDRKP